MSIKRAPRFSIDEMIVCSFYSVLPNSMPGPATVTCYLLGKFESILVSIATKHNKHVRRVQFSHFYHLAKRYCIIFGWRISINLRNHVGRTYGGEANR